MAMLVSSVEEGSLSAAARKLRIPVATLTRNVNDLEALVGTKLLVRSTRKLELTDAGADYVVSAKQILEQVDEQERRAAGEFSAPRGELVITTPVQIARLRVLRSSISFSRYTLIYASGSYNPTALSISLIHTLTSQSGLAI
jgi:DNA-binding transcriptional LysR family regulator